MGQTLALALPLAGAGTALVLWFPLRQANLSPGRG